MPYSYLIDVGRKAVFSRAWGVLTDDEIAAHARGLKADPRFGPEMTQVIDTSGVSEFRITSAGVKAVADSNPFHKNARRAVFVSSEEAFGLARMFWSFSESSDEQFAIVRTLAAAMEWIGVDAKTPWPDQAPDATFGVV